MTTPLRNRRGATGTGFEVILRIAVALVVRRPPAIWASASRSSAALCQRCAGSFSRQRRRVESSSSAMFPER
jgi:hypothetical protein